MPLTGTYHCTTAGVERRRGEEGTGQVPVPIQHSVVGTSE